ncbi:MAG: nucleoside triphosphate pyrophosphohydrolase [Deltaproteobacteria bacterium]|nr:nucleoside triphosphate pyrophosphohydrolase [Deltaproteobacteria bacterium]
MARLRAPDGCAWDREQDHHSLRSFLIEEAYEVLEAIDNRDAAAHCEELGDVLFQIVFQCQVASEKGWFDMSAVINEIASKITRRHPHVFGTETAMTSAEVVETWERVKKEEKKEAQKESTSAIDSVPKALPALLATHKLSERAARVGFDWENADQVFQKVNEEFGELTQAIRDKASQTDIAWEIGDLIFALANLARHLNLCAEDIVREANKRFSERFRLTERLASQRKIDFNTAGIDVLEEIWQAAKSILAQK